MRDNWENSKSGGITFCGLLAVAFIVLKITDVISWNWLWVLAPIWVPVLISLLLFAIGILFIRLGEKKGKK